MAFLMNGYEVHYVPISYSGVLVVLSFIDLEIPAVTGCK